VYDGYEYAWRVYYEVAKDKQHKLANVKLDVKFDSDAEIMALPADVLVEYILENKLAVSAFGTILDQSSQGLVPEVLTSWFLGRKNMQAEKKKHGKAADEILKQGIKLTAEELKQLQAF
jgi:hypothetical protein